MSSNRLIFYEKLPRRAFELQYTWSEMNLVQEILINPVISWNIWVSRIGRLSLNMDYVTSECDLYHYVLQQITRTSIINVYIVSLILSSMHRNGEIFCMFRLFTFFGLVLRHFIINCDSTNIERQWNPLIISYILDYLWSLFLCY